MCAFCDSGMCEFNINTSVVAEDVCPRWKEWYCLNASIVQGMNKSVWMCPWQQAVENASVMFVCNHGNRLLRIHVMFECSLGNRPILMHVMFQCNHGNRPILMHVMFECNHGNRLLRMHQSCLDFKCNHGKKPKCFISLLECNHVTTASWTRASLMSWRHVSLLALVGVVG